ncbi:UNVERIFIED_ORG: hypothetical protein J2811_003902 [Burkholderia cepacia]|nr:hypothetical protein [Burkholderia cepacia]PZX00239.1 hypothetical protein DFS13_109189 [Burkholderia sp. 28_3]RAS52931.1 hypothetical protein DFS07_10847 [Burkholderia cenocepacia]MDP9598953.1 hypothetical protein [Burkholderia cepacia]MDP9624448.1 hypothetical protein [Burkholderia cepacia]
MAPTKKLSQCVRVLVMIITVIAMLAWSPPVF